VTDFTGCVFRARQRDVLNNNFEEFLSDATPEETYLLAAILESRNGGLVSQVSGVDEIPLGEVFACELDRNDTYIRLPKGYRAKVQKYVDALQAVEDKAD